MATARKTLQEQFHKQLGQVGGLEQRLGAADRERGVAGKARLPLLDDVAQRPEVGGDRVVLTASR